MLRGLGVTEAARVRRSVVFWQTIVGPHMTALVDEFAARGHDVTFVAQELMSSTRSAAGWEAPILRHAKLVVLSDTRAARALVTSQGESTVHLTQGVRGPALTREVVRALRATRARWIAIMERVDTRFGLARLKRIAYERQLAQTRAPDGILAIGAGAKEWCVAAGAQRETVFPFAYFLSAPPDSGETPSRTSAFQIAYAGRLLRGKRVDLLLKAVASLDVALPVSVSIVGSGPELRRLQAVVQKTGLTHRVSFQSTRPMDEVRRFIASADLLVLPSDHDGWGAVVSEALLAGVPAIASDACGSATAIRASGVGGVFRAGSVDALRAALERSVRAGPPNAAQRSALARWANCLNAQAGARYLDAILSHIYDDAPLPSPPWALESPMLSGGNGVNPRRQPETT